MATMEQVAGTLASVVSGTANNHYTLTIEGLNLNTRLSILSIDGQESLNQPWRYEITFTCADK